MISRLLLIYLLILPVWACTPDPGRNSDAEPDSAPNKTTTDTMHVAVQSGDTIVFFGDSITEAAVFPGGYISVLDSMLRAAEPDLDLRLVGAGISGNKVPDLLARVDRDVLALDPDVVVIYIGINDVWHWVTPGLVGTESDVYRDGLETLLVRIRAAGSRVLLCTPTVIGEAPPFDSSEDSALEEYAAMSRAVASAAGVPLCDLREAFKAHLSSVNDQRLTQGVLTTDGVHLNPAGNRFVAAELFKRFDLSP